MRYLLFLLIVMGISLISLSCEKKKEGISLNTKDSLTTNSASKMVNEKIDLWNTYTYKERVGLKLYGKYCAICHGTMGKGDGFNAYNLDPHPTNLTDSLYMSGLSNKSLNKIISYGGLSMNKSVLMPAYENTLNTLQINSIIAYLRKLSEGGIPD